MTKTRAYITKTRSNAYWLTIKTWNENGFWEVCRSQEELTLKDARKSAEMYKALYSR